MNAKIKDILIRAGKTFVQAALAYAVPALSGINFFDGDKAKTLVVGIAISALAAGISAAWNAVIMPSLPKEGD